MKNYSLNKYNFIDFDFIIQKLRNESFNCLQHIRIVLILEKISSNDKNKWDKILLLNQLIMHIYLVI